MIKLPANQEEGGIPSNPIKSFYEKPTTKMIVNVEIQILGKSLLLSVSMHSDIILEDLF